MPLHNFASAIEATKMLGSSYQAEVQPPETLVPGQTYTIMLHGTRLAVTCVEGTSHVRLRQFGGWATQRFQCVMLRERHMGFLFNPSDSSHPSTQTDDDPFTANENGSSGAGAKGRYLGYDSTGTLTCKATRQRGWEHVGAVADDSQRLPGQEQAYMLWMARGTDSLAPVSRVSGDKLRVMPASFTYFSFLNVESAEYSNVLNCLERVSDLY